MKLIPFGVSTAAAFYVCSKHDGAFIGNQSPDKSSSGKTQKGVHFAPQLDFWDGEGATEVRPLKSYDGQSPIIVLTKTLLQGTEEEIRSEIRDIYANQAQPEAVLDATQDKLRSIQTRLENNENCSIGDCKVPSGFLPVIQRRASWFETQFMVGR